MRYAREKVLPRQTSVLQRFDDHFVVTQRKLREYIVKDNVQYGIYVITVETYVISVHFSREKLLPILGDCIYKRFQLPDQVGKRKIWAIPLTPFNAFDPNATVPIRL